MIPDGNWSDHDGGPTTEKGDGGPSWVAAIINRVAQATSCDSNVGGYWYDTVILVTWDDWGGYYDHVVPYAAGVGKRPVPAGFCADLVVVFASNWPQRPLVEVLRDEAHRGETDTVVIQLPAIARCRSPGLLTVGSAGAGPSYTVLHSFNGTDGSSPAPAVCGKFQNDLRIQDFPATLPGLCW